MKKATELLNQEEIEAVEAAIADAEKKTTAEIVPVVSSVSGRYDRAEDLFAFLLSLVALGGLWYSFHGSTTLQEGWGAGTTSQLGLWITIGTMAATYVVGMVLASRIPLLRRPFIGNREMHDEVERSARETFQRLNLRQTQKATGILLYTSLYERRVHVVGDDSITAVLSQEDWQGICDLIVAGFKQGKPEEGLRLGIHRSGELLAKHFPAEEDNPNELFDTLHLIDA